MISRPPYFSLALISSGSLAYEVLLMRLFSIIQWHHFAYMIIALALLGYGISGTLVSIYQRQLIARFIPVYISAVFLFGITSFSCFYIAQSLPLNFEEIFWNFSQVGYLFSIFVLLAIPFLLAASAICLTLMYYPENTGLMYSVNLLASGIGSVAIMLLLYAVYPQSALLIIGIFGLLAGLIACVELGSTPVSKYITHTLVLIIVLISINQIVELNMSPYKPLKQALQINGSRIIDTRSSPLGYLTVIENRTVPLRHVPGLSLKTKREPPAQLGVFTDGDNLTVITRFPESIDQLEYLDQTTGALPYHMNKPNDVLIVGSGGGSEILLAIYHGTPHIDAVEVNPQLIELVGRVYGNFSGNLYSWPNVSTHINEARDYIKTTGKQFDLIQISLLDSFSASASGLHALNESRLYTTEAIKLYISKLKPGGYLVLTRWIKLPPRDTLKLLATSIEVLNTVESGQPSQQLALIRGWQTSTLLIKNGALTPDEINAIQNFCDDRLFDTAFLPGIKKDQVNRHNILREPYYYSAATALLGGAREDFLHNYKFNLTPASDDKPYFHNFFKWSSFLEILSLRDKGGMPLIESGYIVLLATLLIAVFMSVGLILIPVLTTNRMPRSLSHNIKFIPFFIFFFFIGLAFLLLEIAFIHKFVLFLHHPIHSVSVILASFLVFAGVGSNFSTRIAQALGKQHALLVTVFAISSVSLFYAIFLEKIFDASLALPLSVKFVFSALLIAPLALFMGIPFPLAISGLLQHAGYMVPWAWGINGCASVISAILATMLAMHYGLSFVIGLAVLLYIIAAISFPKPLSIGSEQSTEQTN
jgi:hypothetical protein